MSENTVSTTPLTREQLEAALNQMKEWYPEEAQKIDEHKETVIAHLADNVEIPASDPIREETAAPQPMREETAAPQPMRAQTQSVGITLSPCVIQAAEFCAEAGTFIVTIAGMVTAGRFNTAIDRWITSAFAETPAYVKKITPLIKVFTEAEGKLAKAKALAPIAQELWNTGVFKVTFDIVKNNSTYLDWLIDGAIAIGQIIVWVASEFIAAIAEFAVAIMSAVHLLRSGKEACDACFARN